jgi:lipopolysaccharide/colanic/teichoic acid biosynthesis glycosyltransferase
LSDAAQELRPFRWLPQESPDVLYAPTDAAERRRELRPTHVFLKGLLDWSLLCLSAALVLPMMLAVALLVRMDGPGPILYRRRVLGLNGRQFDALKFRTMSVGAESQLADILAGDPLLRAEYERFHKLRLDPRVTRIGKFLRRYSLDELPQWINVLRGEMSFVGPRMVSPEEADRYGQWKLELLAVKPGLTGLWQVMGRGSLPYDERVRLNISYVRNYSVWLDLEILLRTVPTIMRGDAAY